MTKKYDYRMHVITKDEAMEFLGFTNEDKLMGCAVKYAGTYVGGVDGSPVMFSYTEVKAMASAIGREVFIPDEVKARCIFGEVDERKPADEGHEPMKRLEHPFMEDHKCLENCEKRDSYGFCRNGDHCTRYNVNTSTSNNVIRRVNEESAMNRDSIRAERANVEAMQNSTITEVQDIMMWELRRLVNEDCTDKELDRECKRTNAISNLSKNMLMSMDLKLRGYSLMTVGGIDGKGIKSLL